MERASVRREANLACSSAASYSLLCGAWCCLNLVVEVRKRVATSVSVRGYLSNIKVSKDLKVSTLVIKMDGAADIHAFESACILVLKCCVFSFDVAIWYQFTSVGWSRRAGTRHLDKATPPHAVPILVYFALRAC